MGLIFRNISSGLDVDSICRKILSEFPADLHVESAYPDVIYPSSLISNFKLRDEVETIGIFADDTPLGVASFVWSTQTFLSPGFLNRIFFFISNKGKGGENRLVETVERFYVEKKVSKVSYIRVKAVEKLSPTSKKLRENCYRRRFSQRRMMKILDAVPPTDHLPPLSFRRVRWERNDLTLFMKTWAQGFGWPQKDVDKIAEGMTVRLLARNAEDPNFWINFLVEDENRPVGTAAFLTFPESAYVVNVSTLKKFRRRGVATYSMISLMKWCKTHGFRHMVLDVGRSDVKALNLYRKLGFTEYGLSTGFVKTL